ncbi:MAG: polyphosphate polymerase domain-containing protein [Planctomycetales bacterium]|nr:polyphosphate polymerase domain-containing protein [Planctomycetales bacterium]
MTHGRYEFKYSVTAEQRLKVLDAANEFLVADPHGEAATYPVSSLYFDTAAREAYWSKLDGERYRKKFRLRYYEADPVSETVSAAFMEIKHRIGNRIFKQRARVADDGATAILRGDCSISELGDLLLETDETSNQLLDQILCNSGGGLEPAVVIAYQREAWMGLHDPRFRLTFDSACMAYAPDDYMKSTCGVGHRFLDADRLIMELKFDHAVPCWIRDIVQKLEMSMCRFSKYATGAEEQLLACEIA